MSASDHSMKFLKLPKMLLYTTLETQYTTINFGSFSKGSLRNLMLITAFKVFLPEGHREPRSEVGSLSPTERRVRLELRTFQF